MIDVADEDPLEPVREMVREMIENKREQLAEMQVAQADFTKAAVDMAVNIQHGLVELHQLELALNRLRRDE